MKLLNLIFMALLSSCATYRSNIKYTIQSDLTYGSDEKQAGDLYLSSQKNKPVVFLVHGGGWSGRSKADMNKIAESLASHGFNVFNLNYRLAPKFKHPAPVEDLSRAVEYIKKNHSKNLDTNKIGMWGYSSGAHTVMLYGLDNPGVTAVVGGGGPYDLTWWPESPIVTPYLGYKRDSNVQGWLDASPVSHLKSGGPALFLYHAKSDALVEYAQMHAFDARAKLHGLDTETHTVKFWGHINTFLFSTEAVKKSVNFLLRKLK